MRTDLRAGLTTRRPQGEAREQFDQWRQRGPARFQPGTWRPGTPPPVPHAPEPAEGTTGLREYLEAIRACFGRHVAAMITYLGHPGVPRTQNHAERANRGDRAVARPRYGWAPSRGQRALLVARQGFDSS